MSFSLSGSLLVAGGYCVEKAYRTDRSLLPLAIIPAVFGLQQMCEGWVWTGLHWNDPHLVKIAAIAYLFFALCFWPAWVPLSMLFVQRRRRVHALLFAMTGIGVAIGIMLLVPLLWRPDWLHIGVEHHSIHYNVSSSPAFHVLPNALWQALYFLVVATPLLVSGSRKLVHFGMALILSAAATHILLADTFASAWCCFAAAMSLYVVTVFYKLPRRRTAAAAG